MRAFSEKQKVTLLFRNASGLAKMHLSAQAKISKQFPRPLPPNAIGVKPISVPVYDLPEYLCVETKWVTRQYAMENNLPVNRLPERIVNGGHTEVPLKPHERANATVSKSSQNEDVPSRERCIQTEEKTTSDVGVQCCRDEEDWDWDEPKLQEKERPKDSPSEEAKFLIFVSENTSMFPNGMLECLTCGEVASSLPEHQGHMKSHFGPGVLCCQCGQRIAHEKLVRRHNLSCPSLAPRKATMLFKCPHPLCSAMCYSEMQLLHHLKKHSGRNSYRCLQCKQNFKTATAFLLHRKAVRSCSKAKCLTLFRNHQLPKETQDLKRCSVCLKRFSSARICNRHRRKCILGHHQGLSKAILQEL